MAGEVFAVTWRGQQAVDDLGESVGRGVSLESGDLGGRRGEARQHVGRAADERGLVGLNGRRDAGGDNLRVEEAVDWAGGFSGRNGGRHDWLETPPVFTDREEVGPGRRDGIVRDLRTRIGRAAINPLDEVRDNLRVELRTLLRHLQGFMAVIHGLNQDTLLRIARDDGRAFFTALEQAVAIIEAEVAFLLLSVVAFVALRHEHRTDLRLKEFYILRLKWGGR